MPKKEIEQNREVFQKLSQKKKKKLHRRLSTLDE